MRRLAELLQLDRALVYAMIARGWQAVSGPITIVFLFLTLSLPEQGIYYSLASITGIQLFFELGLLNILVSQAGNQAAHLDTRAGRQRIGDLIHASSLWFSWAAVLFSLCALAVGWRSLRNTETTLEWQLPLVLMVAFTAISIALAPAQSILEGVGYRDEVYRYRLFQMMLGHLSVWTALATGCKLWALVAAAAVQAVCMVALIYFRFGGLFRQFSLARHSVPQPSNQQPSTTEPAVSVASSTVVSSGGASGFSGGFSWVRDLLPLQWRLALISAIYHVATQFFTLIVLWFESKEAAGRLGMTLSATGAIQAMALAWVQTKFPVAAREHGAGNREAAGTMWRKMAIVSTLLLVTALTAAWAVVSLLPLLNMGIERRLIAPWQLMVLSIGIVANHLISIEGFYVMARGSKPLTRAAVAGFSSTAIAVWLGGRLWGTTGVICGYTLTTALVTLPLHTLAYRAYR